MSVINIDNAHYHIHAGLSFTTSRIATAVANAANSDVRFKTGTKSCHVAIDISISGKAQYIIYEAPTISVGTALNVYNNNRNSANVTTATVTHTPTVTATGTTDILNILVATASSGSPILGTPGGRIEFIFKPNTEYLLRCTNTSGGAIDMNTVINWYEV
jgi:hypothetical protein